MNDLPPFAPPFQAISPDFAKAMLDAEQNGSSDAPAKKSVKAPGPVAGSKGDVVFLNVPFAEKDGVKALGARWDAASKKWYVPQGKDLEPFTRWLPAP
jgi:hypothetical protein